MKILITGSSGMVGHNVMENENISKHTLFSPSSKELNLLYFDQVQQYLKKVMPDMIIHCAGKVGGIQANMKDLYGFLTDNLCMGLNIVKASKELGIKQFINLSSSCTYPKDYINPLKEEYILKSELEPTNEGYALAKVSIQKMCEYISKEYNGFLYKTLIPCNLYGRWDKFSEANSHMIPSVIRKIHNAKRTNTLNIDIWGDGEARREFMYVKDLVNCISYIIDNFNIIPVSMNVGLGYDYSINDYYNEVKSIIGYEGSFTHDLTKPVGMKQKLLDVTKQTELGWKPQYSLREGLKETYNFFKEHYNE